MEGMLIVRIIHVLSHCHHHGSGPAWGRGVYSSPHRHLTWSACKPAYSSSELPSSASAALVKDTALPSHPTQRPGDSPGFFAYFPNLLSH